METQAPNCAFGRNNLTAHRRGQRQPFTADFWSTAVDFILVGVQMSEWIRASRIAIVFLLSIAVLLQQPIATAQAKGEPNYVAQPQTFPLWEHGAPGAMGDGDEDQPTLTYYAPVSPAETRTAVIVAPGGSYHMLASNHEGRQVANWLNAVGVTAFVLKYRLGPRYHHPIELGDAQRAIRLVRSRAADFGIQPDRIGIMGFSAGGHLAATAATHFDSGNPAASDPIDRTSAGPNFAILGYPVISMSAAYAHQGSATNLLGENANPELRRELSNELQVTPQTPPTFLFATSEDTLVPPENSVAFYLALHKAGVPAELHVFEKGPHGVGLDLGDPATGEWPALVRNWLRARGLLTK
jgi:acetyl esterase/lipase